MKDAKLYHSTAVYDFHLLGQEKSNLATLEVSCLVENTEGRDQKLDLEKECYQKVCVLNWRHGNVSGRTGLMKDTINLDCGKCRIQLLELL